MQEWRQQTAIKDEASLEKRPNGLMKNLVPRNERTANRRYLGHAVQGGVQEKRKDTSPFRLAPPTWVEEKRRGVWGGKGSDEKQGIAENGDQVGSGEGDTPW